MQMVAMGFVELCDFYINFSIYCFGSYMQSAQLIKFLAKEWFNIVYYCMLWVNIATLWGNLSQNLIKQKDEF